MEGGPGFSCPHFPHSSKQQPPEWRRGDCRHGGGSRQSPAPSANILSMCGFLAPSIVPPRSRAAFRQLKQAPGQMPSSQPEAELMWGAGDQFQVT